MRNALTAGTVGLRGHDGDEIEAYVALAHGATTDDHRRGAVVVIHHMPGFDRASKEIVRRFAADGYLTICPNLHFREAPGADADDAAAATRAAGGVPDERLVGDTGAARDYLLGLPASNGRSAVIGFCSGGRQSVLAACAIPFDAAVDCYGAFTLSSPPPDLGRKMGVLRDRLPDLACPLLGLFGNDDSHPSPAEVDELDELLDSLDKPHEFHRFDDAGHAFFAVDRPSYRPAVAGEAWVIVDRFLEHHLTEPRS